MTEFITKPVKVVRRLPENIVRTDEFLFNSELSKELNSLFIQTRRNLFIIKGHAIFSPLITPVIQYSHSSGFFTPVKERLKISFELIKGPLTFLRGHYYWATDDWSNNYFHWMIDSLQRIYLLEKLKGPKNILIRKSLYEIPFIKSSLKYIESDIELIDENANAKVRLLTSVSYPAPVGNFNPLILLDYRQWLFNNIKFDDTLKVANIYISRKKANIRKVINDDEVISLLEKYKFKVVCLEDYSWEEQASLFKNAKNIISIHGAGLTNCIFSTNAKVLELRKTNDNKNNCYFSLCNLLNHKYFYLLDQYGRYSSKSYDDLFIDLEQLESIVVKYMLA